MKHLAHVMVLALVCATPAIAQQTRPSTRPASSKEQPMVKITTNKGDIKVRLFEDKAPISTANFLRYVDEGFYAGTVFHRVIPTFMIQGGGMGADLERKPTHDPIKNEAGNGLDNTRGTLAMARTSVVDSATSQFFINVVDNDFLNHRDPSPRGYGYAVFGEVVEGMDVVDAIKDVPTTTRAGHQNVPVEAVVIESMERVE